MNRQTSSAVGMLVKAYRCILINARFPSIKSALISRRKCLATGAALFLGAAGLSYSTVSLADENPVTSGEYTWSGSGDFIINASGSGTDAIRIDDEKGAVKVEITTSGSGSITLTATDKNDNGYGIYTEDNKSGGEIKLDSANDLSISSYNQSIQIDDGVDIILNAGNNISITADASQAKDEEDADAISLGKNSTGDLTISGSGTVTIKSTLDDGVFTDTGSQGTISITSNKSGSSGGVTIEAGNNGVDHRGSDKIEITSSRGTNTIKAGIDNDSGYDEDGIRIAGSGSVSLDGKYGNEIEATDAGLFIASGSSSGSTIEVKAGSGSNKITSNRYGVQALAGTIKLEGDTGNTITVRADSSVSSNEIAGIYLDNQAQMSVDTGKLNGYVFSSGSKSATYGIFASGGASLTLNKSGAKEFTFTAKSVSGSGDVVAAKIDADSSISCLSLSTISLEAYNANNSGDTYSLDVQKSGSITLSGDYFQANAFIANQQNSDFVRGINALQSGSVNVTTNNGSGTSSIVVAVGKIQSDSSNSSTAYGVYAQTGANVNLTAEDGYISIMATNHASLEPYSEFVNDGAAVYAESSSNVSFTAKLEFDSRGEPLWEESGYNHTLGSVYSDSGSTVTYTAPHNFFSSSAIIANAGNLNGTSSSASKDATATKNVVSSLYAEDGAEINISSIYSYTNNGSTISGSGINSITSDASSYEGDANNQYLERTVWAYNQGKINIEGYTSIMTGEHMPRPLATRAGTGDEASSNAIAIAAGTAIDLDKKKVSEGISLDEDKRAQVNLSYANSSEGYLSSIYGDVLSAYAGVLNIDTAAGYEKSGIDIYGNLLAGNGGVMNVNLGTSGSLVGRIDDYGQAGVTTSTDDGGITDFDGQTFRNPAFSSEIYLGGAVNLTMGDSSKWVVTGQSWVTSITTDEYFDSADKLQSYFDENSQSFNTIPLIDLTASILLDHNETGYALTINSLEGDAQFKMTLNSDRALSDMLYIKNAQGNYVIELAEAISKEDISDGGKYENLRFATVGAGSNATFTVYSQGTSLFNNFYEVGTAGYEEESEQDDNLAYNGENAATGKPGNDTVNDFFTTTDGEVPNTGDESSDETGSNSDDASGEDAAADTGDTQVAVAKYAVLASNKVAAKSVSSKESATNAANDNTTTGNTNSGRVDADDGITNVFLKGIAYQQTSDVAETVLSMSRANYFNAVYLDTFNKRQGEARYTNPAMEDGVWVRMRHDNIGQKSQFRSKNTMFELGYDHRLEYDSGNWHVGAALDYMHGKNEYDNVEGDGDMNRYGAWLYGTWLGKDGQYLDLILKYGHLDNDFEIYTAGTSVSGDYDNDVFSASAEYGIKFCDEESKLFIEPQLQLQYSYVTDADYTTSAGARVEVDAIESLIGRVGLRLGRDFSLKDMPISMYLRGDIMHEFMGDQDVYAYDNSGLLKVSYDNDETWYDLGLGISVQANERTYIFMEAERVFGANYADTYVFSAGFRHSY